MTSDRAMAIVWMPFAEVRVPSIQLGVLAGLVREAGWDAETFHFNLDLAARIPRIYDEFSHYNEGLLGEWLFAETAFGPAPPGQSDLYLDNVARDPVTRQKDSAIREYLLYLQQVTIPEFIEGCLESVEWERFDVVGFSSVYQQNVAALALARRLKARCPNLIVVFGGANVQGEMGAAYLEAFPFIDHICTGEAELCVKPLLHCIAAGKDPLNVPGIATRTETGAILESAPLTIRSLTGEPLPEYDEYFARHRALKISTGIELPIETSRGCWWGEKSHCTFCGLNGNDMQFRTKPVEIVIKELKHLSQRHGVYAFKATDNIMPRQHVDALFPHLRDAPYRFFFEVKSNLNLAQLGVLRDGGVRWIQPGIESLSTEILRLIGKGSSKLHNVRLLKWARWLGIKVSWNLLHGVPGETAAMYEDQTELLRFLGHLEPPEGYARIRMDRFSPLFQSRDGPSVEWWRPWEAYSAIYPPALDLERAAYFFDYEAPETLPDSHHVQMFERVSSWQASWANEPPVLELSRRGRQTVVVDSRFGSSERELPLDADSIRLLEACEDIQTLESVRDVADPGRIAALLEAGLLVQDRALLLSLVLPDTATARFTKDTLFT
ncbi:RiPP maturation radical SAM C-methyltransferase [Rhizobium leguminosarum]